LIYHLSLFLLLSKKRTKVLLFVGLDKKFYKNSQTKKKQIESEKYGVKKSGERLEISFVFVLSFGHKKNLFIKAFI